MSYSNDKYEFNPNEFKNKKQFKIRINIKIIIALILVLLIGGTASYFFREIQTAKNSFSKSCSIYVKEINTNFLNYKNSSYKPNLLGGVLGGNDDFNPRSILDSLKKSIAKYEDFLNSNSKYSGSKQSKTSLMNLNKRLAGYITKNNRKLSIEENNPHSTELNIAIRFYESNLWRLLSDYDDPVLKKIESLMLQAETKWETHMDTEFDRDDSLALLQSETLVNDAKKPLAALCTAAK